MRHKATHKLTFTEAGKFGKRRHRPARIRGLVVKAAKVLNRTTERRGGLRLKTKLRNARLRRKPGDQPRSRDQYDTDRLNVTAEIERLSDEVVAAELERHRLMNVAQELDGPVDPPASESEPVRYSPLGIGSRRWLLSPDCLAKHLTARSAEFGISASGTQTMASRILKQPGPRCLASLTIGRQDVAAKEYDIDAVAASKVSSKTCFELYPGLCIADVDDMPKVLYYHSWLFEQLRSNMAADHSDEGFSFFAVVPAVEGEDESRAFSVAVAHGNVKFGFIGKLDGLKRFSLWSIWSLPEAPAYYDDGFAGGASCSNQCDLPAPRTGN